MIDLPQLVAVNSDGPLYKGIYGSIRDAILQRTLVAGEQLPSSRNLALELGLSRMTVVNAYEQLLAEGYLTGRHGAGTFVADTLPDEYLTAKHPVVSKKNSTRVRTRSLSRQGGFLQKASSAILKNDAETLSVPFQHGRSAIEEFPFNLWQQLVTKAVQMPFRKLAAENGALGYWPLRVAVAKYLRIARAVRCEPEQVVITSGTQQSLDIISRIALDEGDAVWMEDPGYLGAQDAFMASGAIIKPCSRDEDGIDLKKAVDQYGFAKLIYVTPSHQYPLGGSTSLRRRLDLLEWAANNDTWIIEDDYDSEFRYAGRPLASMQGLDDHGGVIYLGTFSKTIFSALRLGCMIVPHDLISVVETTRLISDGHSPLIEQAALTAFIEDGHFTRHVRRMRKLYAERQAAFLDLATRYLGDRVQLEAAASGMHLIGWLPKGVSDKAVSEAAAVVGVRVAPISEYAIKKQKRGGLLFGYAGFSISEIETAMKHLSQIKFG